MELQKTRFNDANREDILNYLLQGGDSSEIILSDKQNELLKRWRFADEKLSENKYRREQVAQFIMATYKVSRDTAYKDIVNAQYVFSSSYPLNKQHLIALRIEYLQKKITDAYLDKDGLVAAKLEKELREYIKMYNDYVAPRTPKKINYIFQQNILQTKEPLTAEEAFTEADEILKELEDKDDF